MTRLSDLEAASSLAELRKLPGRCHELAGARAGQLALDLPDGKRMILEPANNPIPVKDDGGLNWEQVDAVCVLEITEYHRG